MLIKTIANKAALLRCPHNNLKRLRIWGFLREFSQCLRLFVPLVVFAVTRESIGRAVLSEAVRLTMEEEAERQTGMFLRGEIKIKPTFRKMKGNGKGKPIVKWFSIKVSWFSWRAEACWAWLCQVFRSLSASSTAEFSFKERSLYWLLKVHSKTSL